jgi:hypothetical protein
MRRLLLLLILMPLTTIYAQDAPDAAQIYRFIHDQSKSDAGDVFWAEIWEQRQGSAVSWVMSMGERIGDELELTCSRAIFVGDGTPVYTINGELQDLEAGDGLRQRLADVRLISNSELFVQHDDLECIETDNVIANGYAAERCRFDGQDASNLFRLKGAATGSGAVWTTPEGWLARYEYQAEGTAAGSNNVVSHSYDLLPQQAFTIDFPASVNLQCFPEASFPLLHDAHITMSTPTYTSLLVQRPLVEIRNAYRSALTGVAWSESLFSFNHDNYQRALPDGGLCSLSLRYQASSDGSLTAISVEASPQVDIASVEVPEGFAEPVLVQNADYVTLFAGDVRAAAEGLIAQRQARGYLLNERLTDIRDDSAFVVLSNVAEVEYITIYPASAGVSRASVQTNTTCAGLFAAP